MSAENPYAPPDVHFDYERPTVELQPPQTVQYRTTVEDIVILSDKLSETLPTLKVTIRRARRTYGILSIVCLLFAGLELLKEGEMTLLASSCALVAIGFVFVAIYTPLLARRNLRKFNKRMMTHEAAYLLDQLDTVTLFAEGVQVADNDGHWFRKWKAIPHVESTATMLIIFKTPAEAFGIPTRAFLNESSFDAFCRLAERLWQEAKSDTDADAR